ncbi:hypothetical protein K443DRAFT_4204 [Laccaria amethystina LaAM-08-1]|uniref:Unplaced genomic scaffold K443scaffold_29, whole genome shotgun sequence n=1 Tax=Laccaria amethystina LaAM-08-1 TaxID=1095629 RepID=A0A0C9YAJ8_9AGAR|nr:hypothetical protein K443DRAFT_4204 [Laccaria amethystina LaAM-08-1]
MSFCKNCIKGASSASPRLLEPPIPNNHIYQASHAKEPRRELIGSVNSYVATPTIDYPKDKVVLLLTDVFGPQLVNAQLLADDFAKNGFKTVVPDYLNGDPVPADVMTSGVCPLSFFSKPVYLQGREQKPFDLQKWIANHTQAQTHPTLDKVIDGLKKEGVTTFGATGYCFGGRYVLDLAFDNIISASVVSHPSLLEIPADLEKYFNTSTSPLLINSCTNDVRFPLPASAKADELFGEGKGDMTDPAVKKAKEGAFESAVAWFIEKL